MTSYEERRNQEEWLELIAVRHALFDLDFRFRCLKALLRWIGETSRRYDELNFREYFRHIDSNVEGLKVQKVSTYFLHSLLDEVPNDNQLQMKALHENDKDGIISLCMIAIINPVIDAGFIHSLHFGYHSLIVAYFPDKFSPEHMTDQQLRALAAIPIDDSTLQSRFKNMDVHRVLDVFKKARELKIQEKIGTREKVKDWLQGKFKRPRP